MPTPATRDRLVAAAQELFAAQGVGATSPRQVLAASGVGQGSLYHHFPAKHDLAVAAVSATADQALAAALQELSGDSPALGRVLAYLERPRDALAGCRVGRLTSDQAVMDDDDLRATVRTFFDRLVATVAEVLTEAGVPPDDATDRAHAAVAVVQGGYVLARATGDPQAMRAAVRGFVTLLDPTTRDRPDDEESL
ncbi:TetR family transcriptional regulator [Isoptericola sp. CG 20/1183]|uniref:TetR family transcriptional regulator n=1 Tax=Isoptericola halotolerans TaxID=300560 RepID=A0ABX5EC24_9MICO|nr:MULTISPECIES: TetR/AcrR family transcriptional regulator [Isoptericola]PRZ05112.1 TetR family transcriptional regulator [Isoptericola halotolerans]PRZ05850.1 TetR family transcriptional regulator [Isoptericola sp. CG 20/1183]